MTVDFTGSMGIKRRPAVVVSSTLYHATRPDIVLAVLTTQTHNATSPTDFVLQDWSAAGLRQPSAFRAYFGMRTHSQIRVIGHLTERDWNAVQERLNVAIAVPAINKP